MQAVKSKIVIVGAGGSGKDTLKKRFANRGYKPDVSMTTRPPRKGEVEGVDYHFVTTAYFNELVKEGLMHEHQAFNGFQYGTTKTAYAECDVFILTPPAIEAMSLDERLKSFVIYLCIDESVRRERLEKRQKNHDSDSVERRLTVDREMFSKFADYDLLITDPLF